MASMWQIDCRGDRGRNMESNWRFGNSSSERGRWSRLGRGSGRDGKKGPHSGYFESR